MGEVRIMAMLATMSSKKDKVEEVQRGNGGKTRPMLYIYTVICTVICTWYETIWLRLPHPNCNTMDKA